METLDKWGVMIVGFILRRLEMEFPEDFWHCYGVLIRSPLIFNASNKEFNNE